MDALVIFFLILHQSTSIFCLIILTSLHKSGRKYKLRLKIIKLLVRIIYVIIALVLVSNWSIHRISYFPIHLWMHEHTIKHDDDDDDVSATLTPANRNGWGCIRVNAMFWFGSLHYSFSLLGNYGWRSQNTSKLIIY